MYREWTKKLGQKHWSKDGESGTLCGMPMLGNNYAKVLKDEHKKECEECKNLKK